MSSRLTRRCVGVYGVSGSGKTLTAKVVARGWRRRLVYDPARDWEVGRDVERECRSRGQVLDYLDGLDSDESCSLAYRPVLPTGVPDDEREHRQAEELGFLARASKATGKCVLVVDEGARAAGRYCSGDFFDLVETGRHTETSVLVCSQRPAAVRPGVRGETYADEVYLFRLGRREDLDDVAALPRGGRELAARLATLEDREGYHVVRGRVVSRVRVDVDGPDAPRLVEVSLAEGDPR